MATRDTTIAAAASRNRDFEPGYGAGVKAHTVFIVLPFHHEPRLTVRIVANWPVEGLFDCVGQGRLLIERLSNHLSGADRLKILGAVMPPDGLATRSAADWLGPELARRLRESSLRGVWQEEEFAFGELHPFIAKSLGIVEVSKGAVPPSRYRLNPVIRDRLNAGIPVARGSGTSRLSKDYRLAITLPQPAAERLGMATPCLVGLRFKDIVLYACGTGLGQLVMELDFGAIEDEGEPTAGLLIEAIYALGHDHDWKRHKPECPGEIGKVDQGSVLRLDSNGNKPGDASDDLGVTFGLRDVAATLIAPLIIEEPNWQRLFTFTVAVLSDDPAKGPIGETDLGEILAKRLARRNNAAYAVSEASAGIEIVRSFDTVCHTAAIEGGAVVVAPRGIDFLDAYATNTGPNVYFPIALAARSEYLTLLHLSQGSAVPIEHGRHRRQTLRKLRELRDHLFNFRLAHRFSTVSEVSTHNQVFEAWRRAFRTEQLLKDVNDDVLSATSYMEAARRKVLDRRFGIFAAIVAGGFAYGAVASVVTAFLTMLRRNYCHPTDQEALFRGLADAIAHHTAPQWQAGCAPVWDSWFAYGPSAIGITLAVLVTTSTLIINHSD